MKIVFICDEYPPSRYGGIGAFIQVLARELVARGHQVRVIGVYDSNDDAADLETDQGVQIWRLRIPARRAGWIQARYRMYRTVLAWVRRGDVDLIDVPDYKGWTAGWPKLPVPIVTRIHGTASYFAVEMDQPINWVSHQIAKNSIRRADFLCAVSRYAADRTCELFGVDPHQVTVLHSPVDDVTEPPSYDQRCPGRVMFSGTLATKKGVLTLAKAWPQVVKRLPHAELHYFGKEGKGPSGRAMSDEIGILVGDAMGQSVFVHGFVSREELFQELGRASVAVFPSYSETWGLAPLEAMIRGCPTVFSSRCAGKEMIEHGEHGLLIDPDEPNQIASAIVDLLSDRQLAEKIATNGRTRVQTKFTVGTCVCENENFFARCIERFAESRRK